MDVLEKIEAAPVNGESPMSRIEIRSIRIVQ
jgi:hypothetical protein